jgi:serine/threonine protein kinase
MATSPKDTPQQTGPLEPGTILQGRYAIDRLLGGGGMGMVYLARDQRLANRPCALKEMVDHFIDQAQRIEANEYFAREADTLAQLKHQAIPAITDRFELANRHYLVMEYVEGRNLEEELAVRGEPLPEGLVIDIARQLCDVLSYLHGLAPPIIYRDMKPSNVMLNSNGRVVLVDFGIARLFKAARKGTMIGTLGFAPPEQYQGLVDPRSDIYSLGATLHYVLTGRDPEKFPPFSFPPVRDLRPAVSSNLAGAIDAALAYEMDGRPGRIQDFRDMMLYGRGLDDARVTSTSGTGGLSQYQEQLDFVDEPVSYREPRSGLRRSIGLVIFLIVLGGAAFGGTYLYSNPELQMRLGLKPLFDGLPWKHEELLAKARENPLEFSTMTLALSSREGNALAPPQSKFNDTDLTNARYLKWTATFKNLLAGLEGRDEKVEARFYYPDGRQITSSDTDVFVGPAQTTADFSGVALMPTSTTDTPPGTYKVALYSDDKMLTQESFIVNQDVSAKNAAAASEAAAAAAAKAEELKRDEEARKLAMIDERRAKPLQLRAINFLNTTKTGTALSGATDSFNVSKVLFIGWQVSFENRLYKLEAGQYRVDAAYIGPDGRTLGSVNDYQPVSVNMRTVTFSGRVGNSRGGAFLPGTYTVNFYLNGQYFDAKKFEVLADANPSPYASYPSSGGGAIGSSMGGSTSSGGLLGPTIATGTISGLRSGGNPQLDLRLRPQPNGFLLGELVIHQSGFGMTAIDGYVRGDHLQFQVPYGTETYYFEGARNADQISGTFESTPSGERGTWVTRTN